MRLGVASCCLNQQLTPRRYIAFYSYAPNQQEAHFFLALECTRLDMVHGMLSSDLPTNARPDCANLRGHKMVCNNRKSTHLCEEVALSQMPQAPTQCIHIAIHQCTLLVINLTSVSQEPAGQLPLFRPTVVALVAPSVASQAHRVR
jgi:hypothetical protein